MRLVAKLSFGLFLAISLLNAVSAQTLASTLSEFGDSQYFWPVASTALSLLLVGCLISLISMRRRQFHFDSQIRDLENQLSRNEKTEIILKEAHEELESRVRDRTADLEMSFQKLNDVRELLNTANQRLSSLARVDELTGIANRTQFDETLNIEIKRGIRSQKPVSLIMAEVDFFGHFRHHYGRKRADEALIKVAQSMDNTFRRAPDVVARYDEHSFAVVLPGTNVRDAMRFAERLREVIYQLCVPHPESPSADRITVSVGLATMQPDKLYEPADLIQAAARGLLAAQESGCNAVEYDAIRSGESQFDPA